MSKTSIHIEPCKIGSSEQHNQRLKHLDYVRPDLSHQNERWVGVADLPAHLDNLKTLVKDKTGRSMQAKATPIREGVIVIKQDTTIAQLRGLADAIEQRWGIKTLQIYTHKDEGHTDSDGSWKPNLHAHIVFDWVNHDTGKSIKLSKQDMAEMQTMVADCLEMVRGESSDIKHLDAIQYKTQAEEQRLRTLKEKTMKEEQAREQAQAKAKEVEQKASKQIIADNKMLVGFATDWKKAFKASEERRERITALRIEEDNLREELGLKEAFKSFLRECKDWFREFRCSIGDLALLIWVAPRGVMQKDVRCTADRERGKLLLDGQTIEQVRASKIVVPSSPVQRLAQAVNERTAGQARDIDRRREQHVLQKRQERRGRKI
ncbi:relaxase/mobilization nuclease domain-containing protein [uncultured Porphyromonas sp.]|uniref:relaxase/mobilization nuclease domain-containing protein n=1 Tax=uncultured Porphyromonas sp. TaxID=159274 RepID=UPI0026105BCF|nr:relaxase/mobilization nuclease domain-containing protein [uncultured Porphyromonas sp.]